MKKLFLFSLLTLMLHAIIIEPKSISHRGIINDIKVIGNKVYTVSNDNTLKVWDKSFLDLNNTVYEKKSGNFGNLYTIESNQNYILTAGITGYENSVFVHDKKSLRLVKVLQKGFNAINKIKFSPNKDILALSSGSSLYFYDKNLHFLFSQSFFDYEQNYPDTIYDITFLDKNKVAFVNWDGFIILYDIKSKKIIKTKQLKTRLQSILFINNKLYAGGYDGYIYVFDKNLNSLKKIFLGSDFEALQIKANSSYIAIAGGNGGFALLKDDKVLFKKKLDFVKAIAIEGEKVYVGNNNILLKYNLTKLDEKSKTNILKPYDLGAVNKYFYLNYQSIYDNLLSGYNDTTEKKYHIIDGKKYSYKIVSTQNSKDTLLVFKGSKLVAKFLRDNASGYRHKKVLWYKHYIISGGDYGKVYIYDLKSKELVSSLDDLTDHIKDLAINGDTLFVLDEQGDIWLYNLKKLDRWIEPYLTITIFKDKSFLLRSGDTFYSDNLNDVVCLKPQKLNLVKVPCKKYINKKKIEKILYAQKRIEKNVTTIDLSTNIPTKLDDKINFLFNTSNYAILGNDTFFAWNKKSKKLIKIPKLPFSWDIGDVLEKDGFIYILLVTGNIYKYDKNFKFLAKTTFKPYYQGRSYHLDRYKNHIVSKYKDKLYVFDDDLNIVDEFTIEYKSKERFFWTFIGDNFYMANDKEISKYNLKSKKRTLLKINEAFIKTPQNRIVVKIKDSYYTLDENLSKTFLFYNKKESFNFFNGKNNFYAIGDDNDIMQCSGDEMHTSAYVDKRYSVDYLAGVAELKDEFMDTKLALVADDKLIEYKMFGKSDETKVLLRKVNNYKKLIVGKKYVVAISDYDIFIYTKDLKFIKKIALGFDKFYKLNDGKVYIKGADVNYSIDLKSFKEQKLKKLPAKKEGKSNLYYSEIDNYIYYKSFAVKAKDKIFKLYETNKYIVAISWKWVYVYDKKLKLLGKIKLDNRVYATYCSKDGILYYAVYDKLFKYKIDF